MLDEETFYYNMKPSKDNHSKQIAEAKQQLRDQRFTAHIIASRLVSDELAEFIDPQNGQRTDKPMTLEDSKRIEALSNAAHLLKD